MVVENQKEMSKILLISDNSLGVSARGCESNDAIIYSELNCDFLTCQEFNEVTPEYDLYLVSNFFLLSPESKEFLKSRRFKIISHDFMMCGTRDPGRWPDFKIPEDQLINLDFFAAAETNFLQSGLQKQIFELNGVTKNLVNLAGNLWTDESLDKMLEFGRNRKNGRAFVIDGVHKGVNQSIDMCRKLFIPFDILPQMGYYDFLEAVSHFTAFVCNPIILETFNRILIESKVLGVLPITNQWSGALHEDIYRYNGTELADKLREKRVEIINKLKE